jgi:nicotinamide-nucleotide amidase
MPDVPANPSPAFRPILRAELLAVGTELTVGETTDTNSGDLARSLVARGVTITRIANLPDDLPVVVEALRTALTRADLVVTTGGLGPTPDDLTREAVAEVRGEEVTVDPGTLAWLEGLWARRGHPFPGTNVKQAWVIASATTLPNARGTAPGWWVDLPDGRVIVNLPGPPREMRPMWADTALPRLAERGVGGDSDVRTLRLFGIGESQVAEMLGEPLLRAANPIVATYARHEAVDVRVSAHAEQGRTAAQLADEAEAAVLAIVGAFVWARGDTTWARSLDEALGARGWTLAISETGTDGALVALLRGMSAMRHAEVAVGLPEAGGLARAAVRDGEPGDGQPELREAERVRAEAGAHVGLAIHATTDGNDTPVTVAVVTPAGRHAERRLAFQRGRQGADRAAINGAAVLLAFLGDTPGA